jgi:hypothetical protein
LRWFVVTDAFVDGNVFVVADVTGVDGSAHVSRTGLRPILLLDFAGLSTPMTSAVGGVGTQ